MCFIAVINELLISDDSVRFGACWRLAGGIHSLACSAHTKACRNLRVWDDVCGWEEVRRGDTPYRGGRGCRANSVYPQIAHAEPSMGNMQRICEYSKLKVSHLSNRESIAMSSIEFCGRVCYRSIAHGGCDGTPCIGLRLFEICGRWWNANGDLTGKLSREIRSRMKLVRNTFWWLECSSTLVTRITDCPISREHLNPSEASLQQYV